MSKYRLDSIALLARQLSFAPAEVRAAQLAQAEALVAELKADAPYPVDFVVYRVTGYHPKTDSSDLLAGSAVLHDLCLLIESVSETLDLVAADHVEPVLSIDDVTERFNVTSKTIQRWRRKGLVSRRFTFPDGKRRVGFFLSSIERFVTVNSEAVERGANVSHLSDAERTRIVAHAERLAVRCRCSEREITRRLALRFDRSPLTILHTLRKFDQQSPGRAVLERARPELKESTRAKLIRAARKGVPIGLLAARVHRSRATVFRVLLDDRVERITKRRVKFHDDPLYHQPDAREAVDAIVDGAFAALVRTEDIRVPKGLPPYLDELYRTPLLAPSQERALFLKFNYHKFLFVSARRRFDPELARKRDLDLLERHAKDANAVKNRIVAANLRLVVSVARKHLQPGINLMELVSEGNITLMRAAESFDIHKNVRFSTYATLALMKGFARAIPAMRSKCRGTGIEAALEVADARVEVDAERIAARDHLAQLLHVLNDAERHVVSMHYGLSGGLPQDRTAKLGGVDRPATLEDLGVQLGLTKHRVRQIEQAALAKLRVAAGVTSVN